MPFDCDVIHVFALLLKACLLFWVNNLFILILTYCLCEVWFCLQCFKIKKESIIVTHPEPVCLRIGHNDHHN